MQKECKVRRKRVSSIYKEVSTAKKERNNGENRKDFYLYSLYSYSAAFEEGRIAYSNKNILREMNCHRNKHSFILIYIKITKGIN